MKNASLPVAADGIGSSANANRWVQLLAGLVCMMAVSSPQYVWTLFTKPMLGGPLAALLHEASGSWIPAFYTVIGMDLLTAALALLLLKPMRRRYLAQRSA